MARKFTLSLVYRILIFILAVGLRNVVLLLVEETVIADKKQNKTEQHVCDSLTRKNLKSSRYFFQYLNYVCPFCPTVIALLFFFSTVFTHKRSSHIGYANKLTLSNIILCVSGGLRSHNTQGYKQKKISIQIMKWYI